MLPTKFHFIWLRGFQRRRLKCEKLTDSQWTTSDGKSSHCLWQGELNTDNIKHSKSTSKKHNSRHIEASCLEINMANIC
jgi:hypothetical protein